jgi:hypothetical protein
MTSHLTVRPACSSWPALVAAFVVSSLALPAAAVDFVISDRTLANGNPMNGNYSGQAVVMGASSIVDGTVTRVANVHVDVLSPAQFNFSDSNGGYFTAYSNSVLRMSGGSFGPASSFPSVGRLTLNDTSRADISGGSINGLTMNGAGPGAAGTRATLSGGSVQSISGVSALINNGTLDVSGGSLSNTSGSGQMAILGGAGSIITVSGGLVQSSSGAGAYIQADSAFTMSGGTVSGGAGGGGQWGVRVEGANTAAVLRGGTVNGGVRSNAGSTSPLQATLGGSLTVNGGVFAYGNASVDVTGGSYTRFAGADASFFAMGSNTINFFGTDLVLSAPTAGSVFETNNYTGNFYTFTGGTFSDGQSALGLRLFDAVAVNGNPLGGGFTLNPPAAVPEPATWLLMLLALPAVAAVVRTRQVV